MTAERTSIFDPFEFRAEGFKICNVVSVHDKVEGRELFCSEAMAKVDGRLGMQFLNLGILDQASGTACTYTYERKQDGITCEYEYSVPITPFSERDDVRDLLRRVAAHEGPIPREFWPENDPIVGVMPPRHFEAGP